MGFTLFAQMAVGGLVEDIAKMTEGLHLRDDFKAELPRLCKEATPLLPCHRLRVGDVGVALVGETVVHFNDQRVELHQRQPVQQLFSEGQLVAQGGDKVPTPQPQVRVVPNFARRQSDCPLHFAPCPVVKELPKGLDAVEDATRGSADDGNGWDAGRGTGGVRIWFSLPRPSPLVPRPNEHRIRFFAPLGKEGAEVGEGQGG